MKKLFLCSILVYTIDKFIETLPKPTSQLKVAFIPTAADPYKNKWFVEADRNKLLERGFQVKDLDINGKTKKQLLEELSGVNIVVVGGGNTFYLLQKSKESGFDEIIKDIVKKGIIYVGSSAGAVLAGPNIEPIRFFDDPREAPGLKSFEGLGLIDFIVLPHYDEKNKLQYDKAREEYKNRRGFSFQTLTNKQAIIVEDSKYQII